MGRYILRRLAWTAGVVLAVTLVTFTIFYVLPSGDPAVRFAGKQPTQELVQEVRSSLHLDRSPPEQYLRFVSDLVTGDEYGWPGLGFSFQTKEAVLPELQRRAGVTVALVVGAALLWLAIGIPAGVVAALRRGRAVDRSVMALAAVLVSAPVFWLGLLALWLFWDVLGVLPGTGYTPFGADPAGWAAHMVLPWTVLALLYAAVYARIVRAEMIEVLGSDHIRAARAAGLPERTVVVRHGMRAALAPVVTLVAVDVGVLLGGTIVTEAVFNLQGLGSWLLVAAQNGDLPVTLAVTVVVAVVVGVLGLAADIAHAVIDPRVRFR